ncbi:tRNA-synt-1c domain-containing protein [Mycena indigotica]|uniref:Glutamate--tRNA ligase, mitochondrial n=1 Tax=Mycena indigotica TaxID=2126181 RepID=A0A8H6T793_9AGAR|nr:tRNA-synt-1c domain-containing protein [Mycena indigotica]KAF7312231.1 tRNA-synt-1c domain-containing protein [Mycena indigotica]
MTLLRFAPSPTGALHLGGLRMALFNHLFARKAKGKWILRIEDTDASRMVPGSVEGIQKALEWAGLNYDYGPGVGGPHAPYFQSERLDLYRSYTTKLLTTGHAYRCFCSVDTLTQVREKLARTGSNSTYDRRCLHLTEEEVARRVRAGEKHIIRLNTSGVFARRPVIDLVFGGLKDAHGSLSTDPVLLKTDGYPTYHLANVVDDHTMGITHVLRGEEWITSLPLHLDIYSALGVEPPQYAHIPILVNPDGTKMSKRNGDVKVADYIARGWEKDAVLNWLALSGWGAQHEQQVVDDSVTERTVKTAPDSTKVMNIDQLISEFDIAALTHRSSSLDQGKLAYLNRQHLLQGASTPSGLADVASRVRSWLDESKPLGEISLEYTFPEYIEKVIRVLDTRATNIRDIVTLAPYLFVEPDYSTDDAREMVRKIQQEERSSVVKEFGEDLENIQSWDSSSLNECISCAKKRSKVLLPAVRHALTAVKDGPPIVDLLLVLGRKRSATRMLAAAMDSGYLPLQ